MCAQAELYGDGTAFVRCRTGTARQTRGNKQLEMSPETLLLRDLRGLRGQVMLTLLLGTSTGMVSVRQGRSAIGSAWE
jgi:hypothetical protein